MREGQRYEVDLKERNLIISIHCATPSLPTSYSFEYWRDEPDIGGLRERVELWLEEQGELKWFYIACALVNALLAFCCLLVCLKKLLDRKKIHHDSFRNEIEHVPTQSEVKYTTDKVESGPIAND